MYPDHEFDPISPEEAQQQEADAEFARRVRREVRRIERGEADDEMAAEAAEEEAHEAERREAEERRRRREANVVRQFFTGTILLREGVSNYFGYMLAIAAMFFVSIVVMFSALRQDMRYTRLSDEVHLIEERSIRLEEERTRRTTHREILRQINERGLPLRDPQRPVAAIDE